MKYLLLVMMLLTASCNKDSVHTTYCDPDDVLTVYSKQGGGLMILDVLYEQERDCYVSKATQEQNNNCSDPSRHCRWN